MKTTSEKKDNSKVRDRNKSQYIVHKKRRYVIPFDHVYKHNCRAAWEGKTVVEVFDQLFPYQEKKFHQQQVTRGRLLSHSKCGEIHPPNHLLRLGDVVVSTTHIHEPSIIEPPLKLIGQNDNIVAVCKAPSVPVHACGRYRRNTVQHLLGECYGLANLRTVHRLDRVTSGVVLLAKTKTSARSLSEQIKTGKLKKEYLARVIGEFPVLSSSDDSSKSTSSDKVWEDHGYLVVEAPLAHDSVTKKVHVSFSKNVHSQNAITKFRRLAVGRAGMNTVSLIHCIPLTGRTHQIRVHLQYLGHPIVDDPLYGPLCDQTIKETRETADDVSMAYPMEEYSSNWSVDEGCSHCPHVEPLSSEGSGGTRDPRIKRVGTTQQNTDGICLHAMCYYYSGEDNGHNSWCWSCPLQMTPEWATSILGEETAKIWSELEIARIPKTN
jgi:tRNA pseudouridine synthase 9